MTGALVLGAPVSWAEELTGYSTLAVAVFTAALVIAAITAAVLAKKSIDAEFETSAKELEATRDAIFAAQAATEHQLEASRRPLLIDVAPFGPFYPDMGHRDVERTTWTDTGEDLTIPAYEIRIILPDGENELIDPRQVYISITGDRLNVSIPLRNVGNGLAVLNVDEVRAIGAGTRRLIGCKVQRERVPPGETTRIHCSHESAVGGKLGNRGPYELAVPYRDFAGGQLTVPLVCLDDIMDWHLSVKQVAPDELDPRLAPQS